METQTLVTICQWTGAVIGVVGAFAVGTQTAKIRFWGFVGFAASNLVLIVGFTLMEAWPLCCMQVIFLASSVRGMASNNQAGRRADLVSSGDR